MLLLSILVAAPVNVHAQDLSGFTKLLLPAYSSQSISGANGSTFSTVLTGYTLVDTTIFGVKNAPSDPTPDFAIQPALNPIFTALNYGPPVPSGRFLYVEREKADELALQYFLRSSDASGQTADQMTALPIVSEPQTGTTRILRIPIRPILEYVDTPWGQLRGYEYRIRLRVYDWNGNGSGQVTVTPFVEGLFGENGALTSTTLTLDQRDGDDPTFPWYAELPIEHCLPFSAHTPCMAFDMRLAIEPLTPDLEYWPMVSVTDNETQHVTIFAQRR